MKNSPQKRAVKKWKSFLHSPFSMASFSVNDSQLPAGIVISSGGTRRYGAKILGSNETQSREISCHHGLATFRSEISPLRADRRNDGRWSDIGVIHAFLHSPFFWFSPWQPVFSWGETFRRVCFIMAFRQNFLSFLFLHGPVCR